MASKLIKAETVRELCGGVSDMTLWRWLADRALNFPKPIYIARRRYFREAEILEWIDARADARGRVRGQSRYEASSACERRLRQNGEIGNVEIRLGQAQAGRQAAGLRPGRC